MRVRARTTKRTRRTKMKKTKKREKEAREYGAPAKRASGSAAAAAGEQDQGQATPCCELLVLRERDAVHTMMEQKFKVLVHGIAQPAGAVVQSGGFVAHQGQTGVAVQVALA